MGVQVPPRTHSVVYNTSSDHRNRTFGTISRTRTLSLSSRKSCGCCLRPRRPARTRSRVNRQHPLGRQLPARGSRAGVDQHGHLLEVAGLGLVHVRPDRLRSIVRSADKRLRSRYGPRGKLGSAVTMCGIPVIDTVLGSVACRQWGGAAQRDRRNPRCWRPIGSRADGPIGRQAGAD